MQNMCKNIHAHFIQVIKTQMNHMLPIAHHESVSKKMAFITTYSKTKHLTHKTSFTVCISDATHFSSDSCCPENQFKVIQRTLEFLVQFDVAVLWQGVGFITVRTMQPAWLSLHIFHVASAFATPRMHQTLFSYILNNIDACNVLF